MKKSALGFIVIATVMSLQHLQGQNITGSGTIGRVLKFTSTSTAGNSLLFDNGTNVGIGTISPGSLLHLWTAGAGNLKVERGNSGNQSNALSVYFTSSSGSGNIGGGSLQFAMSNPYGISDMAFLPNPNYVGMILKASGNVGIGTISPSQKLDVVGNGKFRNWDQTNCSGCYVQLGHDGGNAILDSYGSATSNGGSLLINYYSGKPVTVANQLFAGKLGLGANALTGGASAYMAHINGKVLIGNDPAPSPYDAYELQVDGSIVAKQVVVTTTNWPDYVFKKEYRLLSIKEVEQYIKNHGHLPGITPANEMEKSGLDMEAMLKKQMEKIEELMLYVIELKKENDLIKEQLAKLPAD